MHARPGGPIYRAPRSRICSGACPFFSPTYQQGRKLPGVGTCDRHESALPVTVGTLCLWLRAETVAPERPLAAAC